MPKKATKVTKATKAKTEAKTKSVVDAKPAPVPAQVVETSSTIVSIHGNDYNLSNKNDKDELIKRTGLPKKSGRDTVILLSKVQSYKLNNKTKKDISDILNNKYNLKSNSKDIVNLVCEEIKKDFNNQLNDYISVYLTKYTKTDDEYAEKVKKAEEKKSITPNKWRLFSVIAVNYSSKLEEIKNIEEIKPVGGEATCVLWMGYKSEVNAQDRNEESMKSYISKMNDKKYNRLLKEYKTSEKSKKKMLKKK
jgi:hypothetical protein